MMEDRLQLYADCEPVYETRYERDATNSPVVAVVDAIAAVEGVDSTEIRRLGEAVSVDVIHELFEWGETNTPPAIAVVGFSFGAWNVFCRSDGTILVCEPTTDSSVPVFGGDEGA